MFVVGLIVAIVVLRRRGISPCTFKMNVDNETDGKPSFGDQISDKENDDTVDHHNYFILEKTAQSAYEDNDHYNTAGEPTEDTDGNDHYNAIQDTQEPYEHVKDVDGDYDYTTYILNIGTSTREPDNVYNKLNINRPGDYDHIGKQNCNQPNVSDDVYDTTSATSAHRNDDFSEYNRISTRVNAGQGNISIDLQQGDYDCMKGKQTKSKESGYDHVHI
ncbi:uncharacterized protein LOC127860872 [Dreissena polymorpha]|nr:uncharacterized protein LOC127860872 [Dreissena polymorpha]